MPNKDDSYRFTLPNCSIPTDGYGVPTGINWYTPGGQTFDVGPTFVGFVKNNNDGTSVRQTIRFYPGGFTAGSRGVIKDDSGHPYDVSYTITVSKEQFNNALGKVETDISSNKYYVLLPVGVTSEYNCSDAGVSWMNVAGANLSSSGNFPFTCTPGALG